MSLEGKVAVVTGAASGIGRASAVRLAQDGADVALLDIDTDGLSGSADLIRELGKQTLPISLDLTDRAAIENAFGAISNEMGTVDILLSNAGGTLPGNFNSFVKTPADQFDKVVTLNFRAAIDCARMVVAGMKQKSWGRIINTSSEQAYAGGFGYIDYASAKSGLLGFTRSLARELGPFGITVNAVCPGITRTAATLRLPKEQVDEAVQLSPVRKMAEPEDIAHVVSFLASPGAWFVTGDHIMATGGRTLT